MTTTQIPRFSDKDQSAIESLALRIEDESLAGNNLTASLLNNDMEKIQKRAKFNACMRIHHKMMSIWYSTGDPRDRDLADTYKTLAESL